MDDGNGQQVLPFKVSTYVLLSDNLCLTSFAKRKHLKFSIRGGRIPNWLWRSQDPIGPEIRVFDMPRRNSERVRPMDDGRRMGGRPMGARPMGADLWALDAWA